LKTEENKQFTLRYKLVYIEIYVEFQLETGI